MDEQELKRLLQAVIDLGASDMHIAAGRPPVVRRTGRLEPIKGYPDLTSAHIRDLLALMAGSEAAAAFESERDLDFAYSMRGMARFRVNAAYQQGCRPPSKRSRSWSKPGWSKPKMRRRCWCSRHNE